MQARHALTTDSKFVWATSQQTRFNYLRFYNKIIKRVSEWAQTEKAQLIAWWNKYVVLKPLAIQFSRSGILAPFLFLCLPICPTTQPSLIAPTRCHLHDTAVERPQPQLRSRNYAATAATAGRWHLNLVPVIVCFVFLSSSAFPCGVPCMYYTAVDKYNRVSLFGCEPHSHAFRLSGGFRHPRGLLGVAQNGLKTVIQGHHNGVANTWNTRFDSGVIPLRF